MQPQGYRGIRDENGIMRAVREYPTGVLPPGSSGSNLQLFIVTNSSMWEDDRFIFGMTGKSESELRDVYEQLGDVSVVLLARVDANPNDIVKLLKPYRVPGILRSSGLTDHAVLPLRNMSKVLKITVPGFPNVQPLVELYGDHAVEALRNFLRLYKGSKLRNRIYVQLHRHLRLLDEFMNCEMFDTCMKKLGYHLNEKGLYQIPAFLPSRRIEIIPEPKVVPFVKDSAPGSES